MQITARRKQSAGKIARHFGKVNQKTELTDWIYLRKSLDDIGGSGQAAKFPNGGSNK